MTWTGGKTPTGQDSLFQFLAQPASAKTYTFHVQQTYSDGSIVNWSGSESSDAPAPTIEVKDSLGGSSGTSALTIVALIVAVLALVGGRDRPGRARSRRWRRGPATRMTRVRAVIVAVAAVAAAAGAAQRGLGARVPDQDRARGKRRAGVAAATVQLTYDEAVEPRFAIISVTNAAGHQVTDRRRSSGRRPIPDTLVVPLRPHLPEGWYLIYWRAISVDGHPVQGAFTYAVGPNPGPAPQFPVPEALGDRDDAEAADRALGDVPVGDDRDRPVRDADADRAAADPARRGDDAAGRIGGVRGVVDRGADRDPRVPGFLGRQRLASLGVRSERARAAVPRHRVRARDRRLRDLLCAVLPSPRGRRCGWIGRSESTARSPSSRR